jgi:hypothetical protein
LSVETAILTEPGRMPQEALAAVDLRAREREDGSSDLR